MMVDRQAFSREMALPPDVVMELYQVFAQELEEDLNILEAACREGDQDGYARMVHKIKGTSSSYRAAALHALTEEADRLGKQHQWQAALALGPGIMKSGREALEEIAQWTEREG